VGAAPQGFHAAYAFLDSDAYVPLSAVIGSNGMEENSVEQLWTQRGNRCLSLLGPEERGQT
jgi:hypothetical protein